ncbi:MAG: transmembrane anchor protein [Thermohalobaculum sp.]|nr:transmembrane anchor protein [Thermohalobaculum sp.]
MYNAQKPTPEDLPSPARLLRSTVIAALSAGVILVTIVWPAEYGIDPTGVGRALGLAEMGEIKTQLAEEAEADRRMQATDGQQSSLGAALLSLLVGTAHAQEAWKDEIAVELAPGQGKEIKLVMAEGAVAPFSWTVDGGVVNFDLHGDGGGNAISYEKGRAVPGQQGALTAAFTGNHGWFWRNRGSAPVKVTLRVAGRYSEIKRYD